MAMKKRFYTMNGEMMAYDEGGVTKDLITDHLGSITAEINQSQVRTYDTRYSAYGRNIWSTGTGCGFGWVGSYGYRETGLFHMSHYVRARHYSYVTGDWSTVDPLWPDESAYGYVKGRALWGIDPTGLGTCPENITKQMGDALTYVCKQLQAIKNGVDIKAISSCAEKYMPAECKAYKRPSLGKLNSCLNLACADPNSIVAGISCGDKNDKECNSNRCAYTTCLNPLIGTPFNSIVICPTVWDCKDKNGNPAPLPSPCKAGDKAYTVPPYKVPPGVPPITGTILHELIHSCATCSPPAGKMLDLCEEIYTAAVTRCLMERLIK